MLEPYVDINGALRSKRYREIPDEKLFGNGIKFEAEAQSVYVYNQELRDTTIALSQFMRAFSAVYKAIDTSKLDPQIKAGINAMVAKMEEYPTLGDSVFGEYGMPALDSMLERQKELHSLYNADKPQKRTRYDVYSGIKTLGKNIFKK